MLKQYAPKQLISNYYELRNLVVFIMLSIFTIVFLIIIRCRFPKLKSLSEIVRFRYGNHVLKFIRNSRNWIIEYVKSTLILNF